MASPKKSIYQIKVMLKGSKPPIWRRLWVENTTRLDELHQIIQVAMGWQFAHLHQFMHQGKIYGETDLFEDFSMIECVSEEKTRINALLQKEKDKMEYEYDFGDGWLHTITLEKILPFSRKQTLPTCIKGLRACPPEDCGGIWGYEHLKEILSDPNHEEYAEASEWMDVDDDNPFDPNAFDIEAVNEILHNPL